MALKTLTALLYVVAAHARVVAGQQSDLCATSHFVPNISGAFTQRVFLDFSANKPSDNAASVLASQGISISGYSVGSTPIAHNFVPGNVAFGDGTLNLKVNRFTQNSIGSAEIVTNDQFQYASVRTVLKSSTVPGVVQGNFFYRNDTQEIDWEILTSTISQGSTCVPAGIWAVNQAVVPGNPSTSATVQPVFDPRTGFHEYRIDWVPGSTTFFIDGVQRAQLTKNVPSTPGSWIWNVWSSGDPCWSNGPPTADSITQIRSIEILKGYQQKMSVEDCQANLS